MVQHPNCTQCQCMAASLMTHFYQEHVTQPHNHTTASVETCHVFQTSTSGKNLCTSIGVNMSGISQPSASSASSIDALGGRERNLFWTKIQTYRSSRPFSDLQLFDQRFWRRASGITPSTSTRNLGGFVRPTSSSAILSCSGRFRRLGRGSASEI